MTDFIIEPQNGETPLKLYNRVKACTLFTPEFALDILKQTNNPRVMDVLFEKMEKALNDGADYFSYREALLGMVAGRDCRNTIKDKIGEIASSHGDKQTFDEVCGQAQIIGRVAKLNVYDARKLGKKAELNSIEFDKYDDILFVPDVETIDLQHSSQIPARVADFARYPNLRVAMFGWTSFQKGYKLTLPRNVEIVDMRGHVDSFDDFRSSISGYAMAKDNSGNYIYDETIAEAFHDVYINGDLAKPASNYIVKVLISKL